MLRWGRLQVGRSEEGQVWLGGRLDQEGLWLWSGGVGGPGVWGAFQGYKDMRASEGERMKVREKLRGEPRFNGAASMHECVPVCAHTRVHRGLG